MGKKTIFTVGFELPGNEFEYIPYESAQSLLDADIVLYKVGFSDYPTEDYQGTPLFSQSQSVRVAGHLEHWRSELTAATNAGNLVIVFLAKPQSYFRYTGKQEFSGTGRSRVTTNIVTSVDSYSAIPNITSAEPKSGREVRLTKDAVYLASYWSEFGESSPYESFIKGSFTHAALTTKAGDKIVGAAVRGKGTLLLLPPLRFDEDEFTEFDEQEDEPVWTADAIKFGKRLVSALSNLADVLRRSQDVTPPPEWALDPSFSTEEESECLGEIAEVSKRIDGLTKKRAELERRLADAGAIRALLYE